MVSLNAMPAIKGKYETQALYLIPEKIDPLKVGDQVYHTDRKEKGKVVGRFHEGTFTILATTLDSGKHLSFLTTAD